MANNHMYTNQDFHQNQLLNWALQVLAGTMPPGVIEGQVWYDSTSGAKGPRFYDGTGVIDMLSRTNQRDTQTSATISDLAMTVQGYHLNQFATPTASVNMGSQQFSALPAASSSGQAVEYSQFQTAIANLQTGLAIKEPPCVTMSTSNVSIASPGFTTLNGVTLTSGVSQLLLVGQTTQSQDGPWIYNGSGSALTRPTWSTASGALFQGAFIQVESTNNTLNNGTLWMETATGTGANGAIVVGTDTQTYTNPFAQSTYTGGNGVTIATGVISALAGAGIIVDGTGIRLAAAADTSGLRAMRVYTTTLATSTTSYTVNHGLALPDKNKFTLNVIDTVNGGQVFPSVSPTDVNNIALGFSPAPAANQMSVTIGG